MHAAGLLHVAQGIARHQAAHAHAQHHVFFGACFIIVHPLNHRFHHLGITLYKICTIQVVDEHQIITLVFNGLVEGKPCCFINNSINPPTVFIFNQIIVIKTTKRVKSLHHNQGLVKHSIGTCSFYGYVPGSRCTLPGRSGY